MRSCGTSRRQFRGSSSRMRLRLSPHANREGYAVRALTAARRERGDERSRTLRGERQCAASVRSRPPLPEGLDGGRCRGDVDGVRARSACRVRGNVFGHRGSNPTADPSAYVAPNAVLCGAGARGAAGVHPIAVAARARGTPPLVAVRRLARGVLTTASVPVGRAGTSLHLRRLASGVGEGLVDDHPSAIDLRQREEVRHGDGAPEAALLQYGEGCVANLLD